MRYTAIFEAQPDGGYHVFCPALPGCHSEGDTLDQAIANIREAATVYLESMADHGEAFPIEDILIKPVDVATPNRNGKTPVHPGS
jgi:predicted RNase H-like HicB family nuclease